MARRRRGKRGFSFVRVLVAAVVVALLVALGWVAYTHRPRLPPIAPTPQPKEPAPHKAGPPAAARVTLSGPLSAAAPVRDAQIGIAAPAAVLLRHVEMYEWIETCRAAKDGMQECKYDKGWAVPIDSSKFVRAHNRTGQPLREKNPKPPFTEARFFAADLKLDGVTVDPAVVEAQLQSVDLPVKPSDLPPNMAATFTVRDGVLYAGGDPAHPNIGTVRISYRMIPTGPATLSGLQKGSHLTQ